MTFLLPIASPRYSICMAFCWPCCGFSWPNPRSQLHSIGRWYEKHCFVFVAICGFKPRRHPGLNNGRGFSAVVSFSFHFRSSSFSTRWNCSHHAFAGSVPRAGKYQLSSISSHLAMNATLQCQATPRISSHAKSCPMQQSINTIK